jgi:hypothetical protein
VCYLGDMDLSAPHTAVQPRIEGRVLLTLAGTTRPLSGREVSRLSGTSTNGAWRALQKLVEHGLVSVEEVGNGAALLYTLNRRHLAADAVLALTDLRARLIARLTDAVDAWPVQPVHAYLFGSAARGDGGTRSDIDLLLVRPHGVAEDDGQWREQVDTLAESIRAWTGNHAGIAELPQSDIRRVRRERPAIVDELERDAVVLRGLTVQELLGKKQR